MDSAGQGKNMSEQPGIRNKVSEHSDALIMMVDDEPITMEVVQTFLEEFGYSNFIQIENPLEAMAAIKKHSPDLLLLDLIMPKKPGMEILREIHDNSKLAAHLPVVVLTASSDAQDKLTALELGAADFLSKPVDQSELGLRIRNTLAAKAYMDQLAYYDSVTGLPNVNLFKERLGWGVEKAKWAEEKLDLLAISLDNFSWLNSSVGFHETDNVVRIIAERLKVIHDDLEKVSGKTRLAKGCIGLFRTDVSTFTLLIEGAVNTDAIAFIAKCLLKTIRQPVRVRGDDVVVTASIGIANFPTECSDYESLHRQAFAAKDLIIKQGGDNFSFSSGTLNEDYERRFALESHLRRAIELNEMFLTFQPKVDVKSGKVTGVEALLRWDNGKFGLISPVDFIPIAESTKLINSLGEWALLEACKAQKRWRENFGVNIIMSVNVSTQQLAEKDFLPIVKRVLAVTGVDPQSIKLEITESLLLDGVEEKIALIKTLKKLGLQISIDDFGTGYSSLSYLARFPADELKIDRSFVVGVESNRESRALVSTIIHMAHSLNLVAVAEGVETKGQLNFIKAQHCDMYQGYYFSKPLTLGEIERRLAAARSVRKASARAL